MALINCTECGYEMSEYAEKCPKCGCPINKILETNENNKDKKTKEEVDNNKFHTNKEKDSIEEENTCNEERNKLKKHKTINKKWFILLVIILLIASIIIWLKLRNPSIADVSIDKVTTELKNAVNKYDNLDSFHEGLAGVCKNDKWGFIDKLGNEIIECKYDEVDGFRHGVCIVEVEKKKGLINKSGEIITPLKYEMLDFFEEEDSFLLAKLNGAYGIINIDGKNIIPFEYDEVCDFKEEIALVQKGGKYGCVDKSNNIIIPFDYDGCWNNRGFSEGLIALEKEGNFGYLDKMGNVVIPFDEKNVGVPFSSGLATIMRVGKISNLDLINGGFGNLYYSAPSQMALMDISGKQVTDFFNGQYDGFRNGYSVVTDGKSGKKGLIDCNGNLIIPYQYDIIATEWIKDNLVYVQIGLDRSGFVDVYTGQCIIPCVYENAGYYFSFSEGLWPVMRSGKCGFINMKNEVVIDYLYDSAKEFSEGFAVVEKYNKYGYVDRYGKDTFS